MNYAVCRKGASPSPNELTQCKSNGCELHFHVHGAQSCGKYNVLYQRKIVVKCGLWEWYMKSVTPINSEQIHITVTVLRCTLSLLEMLRIVQFNLFDLRGYHTMPILLFINIKIKKILVGTTSLMSICFLYLEIFRFQFLLLSNQHVKEERNFEHTNNSCNASISRQFR